MKKKVIEKVINKSGLKKKIAKFIGYAFFIIIMQPIIFFATFKLISKVADKVSYKSLIKKPTVQHFDYDEYEDEDDSF
jgi:hypothetical protein